jgi:hypothetical protein
MIIADFVAPATRRRFLRRDTDKKAAGETPAPQNLLQRNNAGIGCNATC